MSNSDARVLAQRLYKACVSDGNVTLPQKLTDCVVTSGDANAVITFANGVAAASILLAGDRDVARAAFQLAFGFINGHRFQGNHWSEQSSQCVCDMAERIGGLANQLGLPEIASFVRAAIQCPTSPSDYLPPVFPEDPPPESEILARAERFFSEPKGVKWLNNQLEDSVSSGS